MSTFWDVIVLAILQGVAEFLPISSSGHLVIAQSILDINSPGMRLEIVLHVGTLFSIFFYYRKTFWNLIRGVFQKDKKSLFFVGYIILSAIPAAVFYFLFKDKIDGIYENVHAVGYLLLFTGLVLTILRWIKKGEKPLNASRSILVGIAQAIAILPGVSRSGMTISSARMLGVQSEKAAEFSFIMSTPLLIGGALLDMLGVLGRSGEGSIDGWLLGIGALVSAVVGYLSIALLVKTLKGGHFWLFGIYCFIAGILTILFL